MTAIIGRVLELKKLEKLTQSTQAEFLAVYGRRRIGKTFLISEFFKDKGLYFELTGALNSSKSEQLKRFAIEFGDRFCCGIKPLPPTSWDDAFDLLRRQIETRGNSQKVILFFDELPWLASKKSGFLEALNYCWNRHLSRHPQVILII